MNESIIHVIIEASQDQSIEELSNLLLGYGFSQPPDFSVIEYEDMNVFTGTLPECNLEIVRTLDFVINVWIEGRAEGFKE